MAGSNTERVPKKAVKNVLGTTAGVISLAATYYILTATVVPQPAIVEYPRQVKELAEIGVEAPYNPLTRRALYTLETLTAESLKGTVVQRSFHEEPGVAQELRAKHADYAKSGYDKGHLAPVGNYPGRERGTYTYANAAPQNSILNRTWWVNLETDIRTLTREDDTVKVWVVTGTLEEQPTRVTIGNTPIVVPSHFYKTIRRQQKNGEMHVWAFLAPNEKPPEEPDFQVTVDELEKHTGMNFWADTPKIEESTKTPWPY